MTRLVTHLFSPLVVTLCFAGIASAREAFISTRVLVPIASDQIGEVRLGGKRCRVVSSEPGSRVPVLVVANGGPEATLYDEIRTAMTQFPPHARIEVWGSGGSGRYLIGTQFAMGWVTAILGQASVEALSGDIPLSRHDEIIEKIAKRFAGNGPVRVFWLDDSVSWLDGRGSEDYYVSKIEGLLPLISDSGLTLYPLLIPRDARSASQQLKGNKWGAWLLGSTPRLVHGPAGESLLRAIAESSEGTVLTMEVPRPRHAWQRLPKLEVFDLAKRRVLYTRPFMPGGERRASSELDDNPDFQWELYKIVPQLRFDGVSTNRWCNGRTAPDGQSYITLAGVSSACPEPACRMRVAASTTYRPADSKLARRFQTRLFYQIGSTVCAGPFEVSPGSRILMYSPDGGWLANVELR